MAKVDVIIPCYNYGRFLEACVRSVLEQSVSNIRVLIIDDASSDNTIAVASRLAASDTRVSVVSHPRNLGHIRTYNEGIAWATAEYFLLLSADDLLLRGALRRATMIMDQNPDVVLTHGHCLMWNDELPFPDRPAEQSDLWERQDLIKEMCSHGDSIVYDATAIVRTTVQKKVGGYLDCLPHCADLEMWLRFAAHGAVAYIAATQAIYRIHSSAMSKSYTSTVFGSQQRRQAFDRFFENYVGYRSDFSVLRRRARKSAARLTFRQGADHLRRGRIGIGLQLIYSAIQQDPQLKFFPPFWSLLRFPGPGGRRWAASAVKRATIKVVRGV